jgi:hypothetical protein
MDALGVLSAIAVVVQAGAFYAASSAIIGVLDALANAQHRVRDEGRPGGWCGRRRPSGRGAPGIAGRSVRPWPPRSRRPASGIFSSS